MEENTFKPTDFIIDVLDFPQKGVVFKDITPLLANPKAYSRTIDEMAKLIEKYKPTKILCAESRGFFFGPSIAIKLETGFIPVRKKGKLPRKTIDMEYSLEYGSNILCVHEGDIKKDDIVVFVDDVLATGGTAEAVCKIVKKTGAKLACCEFFYEIGFLGGRKKLSDIGVETVALVSE